MDPETLQRLREQSGVKLDREGRFLHQGEPIEHERTVQALHHGLHRAPDGRWATRLGTDWAYLDVEDVAYFIRAIAIDDSAGSLRAELIDGRSVDIDPSLLLTGAGDALYTRLPDGERARLSRAAQLSLAERLIEEPLGTFALKVGERRYLIGAA